MKFPAFEPIELKNNIGDFEIVELTLSSIVPDENQPRKFFDQNALNDLASSIKQHGVIQPIIVKKIETDKYQIIAGERRWRASQMAGKEVIRAIITNNENKQDIAIALIENVQREDLNPIELAETFYKLKKDHGLSDEAIAAFIGKSRPTVTNTLRLLNLPEPIRDLLIYRKLEMGHARALLPLEEEKQFKAAQVIIEKELSVRQAENLVQNFESQNNSLDQQFFSKKKLDEWKHFLSKKLNAKTSIKVNKSGKSRVVINFASVDALEKFVENVSTENVTVD